MSALGVVWKLAGGGAAPGLRLMLRLRLARGKELPGRLPERWGADDTPRPPGRLLWLHAASVGETASVLPVLDKVLDAAPELTVLFTTGTVTAATLLRQRLPPGHAARVLHRFVPLDVPAWVRRFLDHWRPDAAGFVESELWPNLIAACRARGIRMMLLNARLSPRSFVRWQYAPGLARDLLGGFERVQARSDLDAQRLRALGARNTDAPGDLKFIAAPLPVDEAEETRLRDVLADRPVWLAASTHPGEDAIVFAVHRRVADHRPGLLTILAPRHPDRGPAIAAEAAPLPVSLRSSGHPPPAQSGIWVVDTLGEMGLWFRLAPIVFVGRSLLPPGGGQNPLEPARLGCAIAVGPYTGNFLDHVALLRESDALVTVQDAAELTAFVTAMLDDPAARQRMGERAIQAVRHQGDLAEQSAAALLALVGEVAT